jgi:hypothetical protein
MLPAGSLRCDRLVRSSLASSMVGFIKGGSDGSLPDWRASRETSSVLVCRHRAVSHLGPGARKARAAYLAIFELELEHDFGPVYRLLDDLGRDPALGCVGLPRSRADIIALGHWTRFRGNEWSGRGGGGGVCLSVYVASRANSRRGRPAKIEEPWSGTSGLLHSEGWRCSYSVEDAGCGIGWWVRWAEERTHRRITVSV